MPASVPPGWREASLSEIAEVIAGQSPPGVTVSAWTGEQRPTGLPFIQGNAEFGARFPAPTKWCASPAKQASPGDALLSVRAPVGETNRVDRPLAIGRGVAAIRFRSIEPTFGWHALNHAKAAFERLAQGSTFEAIGSDVIRGLSLRVPPLPEQRAIAAVLDAIDDAIERTEAVSAATEELRRSLLHDLLTRGVPGSHSAWKQVSGLGTLPACWEVVRLGDALSELRYGTSSRLSPSGDYAILRIPNVARGILDTSDLKYADLSEREGAVLSLRRGDLLMIRTNGNPEICGEAAIFEGMEGRWGFASYLLRLRTRPEILDPVYLWTYLRSPAGRKQLGGNIRTSAGNYNLSAEGLSNLMVPAPSRSEQDRIVGMVQAHAHTLASSDREIEALRSLKRATVDALMTGRVRAPIEVPA